jgi:hypothetical protein
MIGAQPGVQWNTDVSSAAEEISGFEPAGSVHNNPCSSWLHVKLWHDVPCCACHVHAVLVCCMLSCDPQSTDSPRVHLSNSLAASSCETTCRQHHPGSLTHVLTFCWRVCCVEQVSGVEHAAPPTAALLLCTTHPHLLSLDLAPL